MAANIEITREWWDTRRSYFQLYTSQAVIKETSQGDAQIASQSRLDYKTKPDISFLPFKR